MIVIIEDKTLAKTEASEVSLENYNFPYFQVYFCKTVRGAYISALMAFLTYLVRMW